MFCWREDTKRTQRETGAADTRILGRYFGGCVSLLHSLSVFGTLLANVMSFPFCFRAQFPRRRLPITSELGTIQKKKKKSEKGNFFDSR